MSTSTPAFAIVGAVNHGKSSVVSSLAENDQVRVSSLPGETVECQRFSLRDLFVFYDTPGFQNARETLAQIKSAGDSSDPLAVFRSFTQRHLGNPDFEAELFLLQPILEGAGIIYVVDGSKPVLEFHAAEMEILRLTGRPRLAIINRTGPEDHVSEWKRRLGQHFNAVREFNAHRATFADRRELLETLAGIEQSWKPKLMRAVEVLSMAWEHRLDLCAETVTNLVICALRHEEVDKSPTGPNSANALKQRFEMEVARFETEAHREMINLFVHRRVKALTGKGDLIGHDLFGEETWKMLGLSESQLLVTGAGMGLAAGAAMGANVDAFTAGGFLGGPTAIGSGLGMAIGAATAFCIGKTRPALEVRLSTFVGLPLPGGLKLSGTEIRVGPYRATNFPWILIDRSLGIFTQIVNRSHARRDEVVIDVQNLKGVLDSCGLSTAHWSAKDRDTCEKHFKAIRKGNAGEGVRGDLNRILLDRFRALSTFSDVRRDLLATLVARRNALRSDSVEAPAP